MYDANGNTITSKTNSDVDITSTAYTYIRVRISFSDSASGMQFFRIGQGPTVLATGSTPNSYYEYVYNTTGSYALNLNAMDNVYNSNKGVTVKFKVDADKPAISVACVKKTSCTAVTSRPSTNNGNYTPGSWSNKCVYCEASSSSGVTLKERACGAAANSTSTSTCLSWSTKKYHDVNSNGISNLQFEATKSTGTTNRLMLVLR